MVQLQVLNKILSEKDPTIITLNNLGSDFFSDYKDEYYFIKEHLDSYDIVPDMVTFLNKFPNFQVIEVTEPTEFLLSELYKDRNGRYIINTVKEMKKYLLKEDIDGAAALYKRSIEGLEDGVGMQSIDITQDTSRYDDYVQKINSKNDYYVSTGFAEIDEVIGGWDRQEELATIVARTNYGKSWILLKCAAAAVEQGLNVGLYSGEMSERKVGYRFDTLVGHISNGGMTHGNESIQQQYRRYIEGLPNRFKGHLHVITPKMIHGPAGVSALKAFIKKKDLDILFIDQHSLLEDDRHGKTAVDKASNISKDLKNLQVMTGIPVISVSQQNREKKEDGSQVGTELIAQSDRIGQDSTVILFLEKKDAEMKLTLVKSRDSANGKVWTYLTDLNTGDFTYIPDESEEDATVKSTELENKYLVGA